MIGGCVSSVNNRGHTATTYVVRPHDTLYSIAWRHDVDYRDLAKWNNTGPDFRITVGQMLILEPAGRLAAGGVAPAAAPPPPSVAAVESSGKTTRPAAAAGVSHPMPAVPPPASNGPAASPRSPAASSRGGSAASGIATAPAAAASSEPQSVAPVGSRQWVWPTDPVSDPRPVPGGGILLIGRLGQDVRAAGEGRVVYTGNGIRGYGNLIIIKHGDTLLSSYAHNRELVVREGQQVAMGQVIAHMGTGPHRVCVLYFEIRINGKPTDPLRYLVGDRSGDRVSSAR